MWEGRHGRSGAVHAVKQISTSNQHETHLKEIWFGTHFFDIGGVPRRQFSKHPGIGHLARMIHYDRNYLDTWIVYEKGGTSLGKALH